MINNFIIKPSRAVCILCMLLCCVFTSSSLLSSVPVAFDIDRAMEICDSVPLDNIEGIWIYPEDNVTVLVLKENTNTVSSLPEYEIRIIDSTDCNLNPGDCIGKISSSADANKFSIQLFTEKKGINLLKPETCPATLSNNNDILTLHKKSSKLRIRFNLNPSVLLPKLWRSLIRVGTSSSGKDSDSPSKGMVKIYPSYDGNGSSRRQPRYL